ncbi:MAG: hypothetical protein EZS28_028140, partial [Streblomastix strix]
MASTSNNTDCKDRVLSNYIVVQQMGHGATSNCYSAIDKEAQQLVCLKLLEIEIDAEKMQQRFLKECSVYDKLDSPFIVSRFNTFCNEKYNVLALELCQLGSLDLMIHKMKKHNKQYFTEKKIVDWMIESVLALQLLQEKKIIHRDIKPANMFLTIDGHVKLGDFGTSLDQSHEVELHQA